MDVFAGMVIVLSTGTPVAAAVAGYERTSVESC